MSLSYAVALRECRDRDERHNCEQKENAYNYWFPLTDSKPIDSEVQCDEKLAAKISKNITLLSLMPQELCCQCGRENRASIGVRLTPPTVSTIHFRR